MVKKQKEGTVKLKSLFNFDLPIFISSIVLMIFGMLFIYSSGITSTGKNVSHEYIMQGIWIITGLVIFFIVMFTDYFLFRRWAYYFYFFTILLLIITLIVGKKVNGARSWLGIFGFGIQPSEFAKLATMMVLADYFDKHRKTINNFSTFTGGMIIFLIPFFLILIQPDMGTALVYIPVFLAIAFVSGIKRRYLFFILVAGILMVVFGVFPSWLKYIVKGDTGVLKIFLSSEFIKILISSILIILIISLIAFLSTRKQYYYWIMYTMSLVFSSLAGSIGVRLVLKDYQIMRLIVFLNPYIDPRGKGWNIIQSITAVGSGGLMGKGFLQGTQSHYRFLPQQSTDFIFSILAEEWGFLGSLLVLIGFGIILIRGLLILINSKEQYGIFLGTGILIMIFFHVVVNIGMAIGIMPITGIPLFFLSYGGSSLWAVLVSLGFIENIYIRRFNY